MGYGAWAWPSTWHMVWRMAGLLHAWCIKLRAQGPQPVSSQQHARNIACNIAHRPPPPPLLRTPRPQVKDAANTATFECFKVNGNRDIQQFIPTLVSCIARPQETTDTIHKLAATTFVQQVRARLLWCAWRRCALGLGGASAAQHAACGGACASSGSLHRQWSMRSSGSACHDPSQTSHAALVLRMPCKLPFRPVPPSPPPF